MKPERKRRRWSSLIYITIGILFLHNQSKTSFQNRLLFEQSSPLASSSDITSTTAPTSSSEPIATTIPPLLSQYILTPLEQLSRLTGNHSLEEDNFHCEPPLVPLYDIPPSRDSLPPYRRIPRFIHLSTKSRCSHPELKNIAHQWHDAFPYDTVLIHDDRAVDRLILELDWPEFPLLKEIYSQCLVIGGAIKVDLWRLLVVYRYGGMYADFDVRPGPELREGGDAPGPNDGMFTLSDSWSRSSQWLFAMEPGHPVSALALRQVLGNVLNLPDVYSIKPVFVTGPHAMWHAFEKFLAWNSSNSDGGARVGATGGTYRSHGYHARKITKKSSAQYLGKEPSNVTVKDEILTESSMTHWQKSLKQAKHNRTTSGSCWSLLNRTDHNYTNLVVDKKFLPLLYEQDPSSMTPPLAVQKGCEMASHDSFGLFNNVSDTMWQELQSRTLSQSWWSNPQDPLEKIDDGEWWTSHNLQPNFDCPQLEKMGEVRGRKEGYKYVCRPQGWIHGNKCLVYSVGSAGDFTFEDELAAMHNNQCEIHVFDPANWERPGDAENKNIHYHAWGLTSTYDKDSKSVVWPKGRGGGFKTFPETLEELGHQNRTIDFFKIDCEGCEWSTVKDWIHHDFRQILIEVHGVPTPTGNLQNRWYKLPMNVYTDYWQSFADEGYALYSKESKGVVAELSFIKLHANFWKENK